MKVVEQIKNYIQLHTSDMGNEEYIGVMRDISFWANNEADLIEYRKDNVEGCNFLKEEKNQISKTKK